MSQRRSILVGVTLVAGTIWLGWAAAPYFGFGLALPPLDLDAYMQRPVERIDELSHPVAVTHWVPEGLVSTGGDVIRLPGVRLIPSSSPALAELVKRGVEIDVEGRVFGLIHVWHWCGNDPVREHLARVDIARVLIYLGEGGHDAPAVNPPTWDSTVCRFCEDGWNLSDFQAFERWSNQVDTPSNNRLKPPAGDQFAPVSSECSPAAA